MDRVVEPARAPLRGSLTPPGDKSVSHRALILSAMAHGTSRIRGLLASDDVAATRGAVQTLGARVLDIESPEGTLVEVNGWGEKGPSSPAGSIDCGNSGTTVRLLAGVVAGWPVEVTFSGDESLSRRPMDRVAAPLTAMGACVEAVDGHLPMTVYGTDLTAVAYESPVASAQVKTLVLLAGLRAKGRTSVAEPAPSRDHTERMLPEFGVAVSRSTDLLTASVMGPDTPHARDTEVPADPSSAAFFAAAAAVVPGSRLAIENVMLNPTRTAAVDVLRRMGAAVGFDHGDTAAGEERGTITIGAARELNAVRVSSEQVPGLIDEIPALAVVATQCTGTTRFEGVAELRVKESDRLRGIEKGLTAMGALVRTGADWLEVEGPSRLLGGAVLDSLGDHRLAMAYHVAGLLADGSTTIRGYDAVSVSYPTFGEEMSRILANGANA
jgi:3-phosphoshikimate 1-carboxyvinyltransferase